MGSGRVGPSCSTSAGGYWHLDGLNSIAVDGAGFPHVVYDSTFNESCLGSIKESLKLVRYAEIVAQ